MYRYILARSCILLCWYSSLQLSYSLYPLSLLVFLLSLVSLRSFPGKNASYMFNFTCGGFFCCCFRILGSPYVTVLIAILGLCNCLPITCIIVLTTFTSSVCPLKYKGLIIHETEKTNKDSI